MPNKTQPSSPVPEGDVLSLEGAGPEPYLPSGLTAEYVLVTPDLAREWLAGTPEDRKVSDTKVALYAAIMRRGEWMPDANDAILFDVNGERKNGQHRLHAVVHSGVSNWFLVVRNVRPEVIEVIDQGYPRNFAQFLQKAGYTKRPTQLADAISYLYKMDNGFEVTQPGSRRPTITQLIAIFDKHPDIVQSLDMGHETYTGNNRVISEHILIAYHYCMSQVAPATAEVFFQGLATGTDLLEGQPVYALRQKWAKAAANKKTVRKDNAKLAAYLVKAWEATREGRSMTDRTLWWGGGRKAAFPKLSDLPWASNTSPADDED